MRVKAVLLPQGNRVFLDVGLIFLAVNAIDELFGKIVLGNETECFPLKTQNAKIL